MFKEFKNDPFCMLRYYFINLIILISIALFQVAVPFTNNGRDFFAWLNFINHAKLSIYCLFRNIFYYRYIILFSAQFFSLEFRANSFRSCYWALLCCDDSQCST